MKKIILLALILACIAAVFSCSGDVNQSASGGDTPTEAYKRLYNAVKSKNTEAIKNTMTEKTVAFGKSTAAQYGTPEEKMFENGFTATTFSETMPAIRDERVKDNMGAVEVWNSRESHWEDLPFVLEKGVWKLAIGETFAGTFKSPGKGRDVVEKEAANAVNGPSVKVVPAPSLDPKEARNVNIDPKTPRNANK
jgi:hypothetical protein